MSAYRAPSPPPDAVIQEYVKAINRQLLKLRLRAPLGGNLRATVVDGRQYDRERCREALHMGLPIKALLGAGIDVGKIEVFSPKSGDRTFTICVSAKAISVAKPKTR